MKRLKLLCAAVILAAASLATISCSDNDNPGTTTPTDKVKPENVFTKGIPAKIGAMTIKTSPKGQVLQIVEEDTTSTFKYYATTRATEFDMSLNVKWDESGDSTMLYLKLNEQGYAKYALEVDYEFEKETGKWEEDIDEWWFSYNADGQLTQIKRTNDSEVTTLTYVDGDITKIETTETPDPDDQEMPENEVCTFSYTDEQHPTPIDNIAGIMLFDEVFDIDMDETRVIYYAGLLGKATKHLPLAAVENNEEFRTFAWEFNADNMPVKFTSFEKEGNIFEKDEELTFTW